MTLHIFLGLTATLSSFYGDYDDRTQGVKDFDWGKFSGPRPWYFLLHKPNEFENQIGCPLSIFASPEGDTSFITSDVYDISEQRHITIYGNATNWNSTGYFHVYDSQSTWTGQFHVLAVNYERYVIFVLHPFYTNEHPLYVGYRSYRPDEETVEEVKQKLQENNIDVSKLEEWPVDHCPQEEFKQSDEDTNTEKRQRKGKSP